MMVALMVACLIVVGAIVLDFGRARLDRQMNKAAADSAAISALEAMRHVDALGNETGKAAPYAAVCAAYEYLKASNSELDALSGTLSDGNGAAVGGACPLPSASPLRDVACEPDNRSTWARFSGTADGGRLRVEIRNGYVPAEDAASFPEENLSTLLADQGAPAHKGCDQLAVLITEDESLGFGRIVTDDDLTTTVRSVARVDMGDDNEVGVALMLLERYDCNVLSTGGTSAKIRVDGYADVPGLIHVDSLGNGDDCGSKKVIEVAGNNPGAIVAGESETTPKAPGEIGVVALGGPPGIPANASDLLTYVYSEPLPGSSPVARTLMTRRAVDDDYFSGVKDAINKANAAWAAPTPDVVVSSGCTGSGLPASVNANAAGTWYFDCPSVSYSGDVSLPNATKVIFKGQLEVRSGRVFNMPRASEVYVNEPASTTAPGLLVKGHFRMHTNGSANCEGMATPGERARLVVGNGEIRAEGGDPMFQACHTSVILMGGEDDGCVPDDADKGSEPQDTTACNGYIDLAGGAQTDWTAPNLEGADRTQTDQDDLEDLAFWTENHQTSSILGSGGITLAGVFVLPNANPFKVGGNGAQDVEDSQFFTRKLEANGNGTVFLKPDPHNMTKVPYYGSFALVR
jgi:hypothetical protein